MSTQSWMYGAILYLYALSLLFFFSDFTRESRSAKRIGEGLLGFVWLLQTVYLAGNVLGGRLTTPVTMFETFFLFSWLLVTVTLAVNRFVRIELLVFLVNVFGFGVLALHLFSRPETVPYQTEPDMSHVLLFIHITLSVGSYAAFLIAAVLSGMYLYLHRRLKKRSWTPAMKRMPSLEKLEGYSYRAVMAGVPMLLMAIALGTVWLMLSGETPYLLDPKVLNSLVILAAYAYYLTQRLSLRLPGHKLALWNLVAFGVVLVNFMLSNSFSQFHQWIWM